MTTTESRQVTYYFPAWLADEVAALAKATDRSASHVVRNLVAEALAARDKKARRKA